MGRKQVRLKRSKDEILEAIRSKLALLDKTPATSHEELRTRLRVIISLDHDSRELALFHMSELLPQRAAIDRILAYMVEHVGVEIDGEEIEWVAAISEFRRRTGQLRVEHGWPIVCEKKSNTYLLEKAEPNSEQAGLWRTMNAIRRSGGGARDRMLALFRAFPGRVITTEQLRYVAHGKDMRRVRELRGQLGWKIMTRKTGRPDLGADEYILVDPEPMEEHDRKINDETVSKVLKRDRHRCQKTGCAWHPDDRVEGDPKQYIELHHVVWHSRDGTNVPDNLVTICNVHHKAVHNLRLTNEADFSNWLRKED